MKKQETFGERLVTVLAAHGITQAELARRMGKTQATICDIVKGRIDPMRSIASGENQIRNIADAIGCDVYELKGGVK